MKIIKLSCLIFMAFTKDCAAVSYWNNTAHKLNKLLSATVQRRLQYSTKWESHFNRQLSVSPGREAGSIRITIHLIFISYSSCIVHFHKQVALYYTAAYEHRAQRLNHQSCSSCSRIIDKGKHGILHQTEQLSIGRFVILAVWWCCIALKQWHVPLPIDSILVNVY